MTTQQRRTIRQINETMDAARFIAQQASREVAELDERCLLIAIEVKLAEGRIEEARAMYLDYKRSK